MARARITRAQVDSLAAHVSSGFRGIEVQAQGRNGYVGLDLYEYSGSAEDRAAGLIPAVCVRTLVCGSAREVYGYLQGMQAALAAIGRDV